MRQHSGTANPNSYGAHPAPPENPIHHGILPGKNVLNLLAKVAHRLRLVSVRGQKPLSIPQREIRNI
jgi:hypothetical protein